jgi:hypothetical protein
VVSFTACEAVSSGSRHWKGGGQLESGKFPLRATIRRNCCRRYWLLLLAHVHRRAGVRVCRGFFCVIVFPQFSPVTVIFPPSIAMKRVRVVSLKSCSYAAPIGWVLLCSLVWFGLFVNTAFSLGMRPRYCRIRCHSTALLSHQRVRTGLGFVFAPCVNIHQHRHPHQSRRLTISRAALWRCCGPRL